jgi:hypothetical protein
MDHREYANTFLHIDIFLTELYNKKTKGCDDCAIAAGKVLYNGGCL